MILYDIVHAYTNPNGWVGTIKEEDLTLEELWKAQEPPKAYDDILIIRDGSSSMWQPVAGNNSVTALSVGDSIALYCTAHNKNRAFKNRFITFSSNPEIVDISMCDSLHDKLR